VIFTIGHSTRTLEEFVSLLKVYGIKQLADIRSLPRSRRHPHFSADALSQSLPAVAVAYRHFKALGGLRKPRRDSRNTAWRNEGFRGYADYMERPGFTAALDELLTFVGLSLRPPVLETREGSACSPSERERTNEANGVPGAAAARGGSSGVPSAAASLGCACGGGAQLAKESDVSASPRGAPCTVIMCAEAVWWRCHRQLLADVLVARGIEVRHIISASAAPPHILTDFALLEAERVSYRRLI
jgi:uncharacterized protein (DUF488 family)